MRIGKMCVGIRGNLTFSLLHHVEIHRQVSPLFQGTVTIYPYEIIVGTVVETRGEIHVIGNAQEMEKIHREVLRFTVGKMIEPLEIWPQARQVALNQYDGFGMGQGA